MDTSTKSELHISRGRRSRRQNLAQGEASAASGTLGFSPKTDQARFSGRQTTVRSAHSLSHSAKWFPFLQLFILVSALMFTGCRRGIHSGTGGWPAASSPEALEISSSAQVVKVTADPLQLARNGSAEAIVTVTISPGYHVNANPATFPYLIATELRSLPFPDNPIETKTPVYPQAITKKFSFAEQSLAVYEGDVTIKLPLHFANTGKSYVRVTSGTQLSQPITVRVQACDDEKCYPPANLPATIPVEVK